MRKMTVKQGLLVVGIHSFSAGALSILSLSDYLRRYNEFHWIGRAIMSLAFLIAAVVSARNTVRSNEHRLNL